MINLSAFAINCTLKPSPATYWVGEAMHEKDFRDLADVPEAVASTTSTMVRNAVHLARLLKDDPYPPR
jgi:hypothetical protein